MGGGDDHFVRQFRRNRPVLVRVLAVDEQRHQPVIAGLEAHLPPPRIVADDPGGVVREEVRLGKQMNLPPELKEDGRVNYAKLRHLWLIRPVRGGRIRSDSQTTRCWLS